VRARHYPIVGDALLLTIEQAMGPRFTAAHADAWRQGYTLIAEFMQQGAAVSRPASRLGGRTG
jgi:hemoglobin-like flavoprotein